jgi:hypothetical protein
MQLRTAAYAVCLCCAACAGCHSAQTAPAQDATPTLPSQLATFTESPKFIFQNTPTFFNKPTSDDLVQQR